MSIFDLFKKIESENKSQYKKPEWIIVGLGNPGKEYETTRHNIGFVTLDRLAEKKKINIRDLKFKALCGRGEIGGKGVLLVKPQTFMNLSGNSVAEVSSFYKIPMEKVIVIYDDVSLPVGKLRIREKGSAGGHNGIKNIIERTGSDVFPRIKIGVGAPPNSGELVNWVLGSFSTDDKKQLDDVVGRACAAVEEIIKGDSQSAMAKFN